MSEMTSRHHHIQRI